MCCLPSSSRSTLRAFERHCPAEFTVMSLSGFLQADEAMYTSVVDELVQWCDPNVLELNVTKTAELVIDFRRSKPSPHPLIIKGQEVSIMPQYK